MCTRNIKKKLTKNNGGTRLAEKVNIDISIIKEASKKYKEEHDR